MKKRNPKTPDPDFYLVIGEDERRRKMLAGRKVELTIGKKHFDAALFDTTPLFAPVKPQQELFPTKKNPKRKNPPAVTKIYPAQKGIVVQGMRKPWGKGRYRHRFTSAVEIVGRGDEVVLRPKK